MLVEFEVGDSTVTTTEDHVSVLLVGLLGLMQQLVSESRRQRPSDEMSR